MDLYTREALAIEVDTSISGGRVARVLEQVIKKTVGRLATYLQAYGDLLVRTNRWDPAVLARFRADPFVAGFRGALDAKATTGELEHVAALIPDEWLAPAATGSTGQCVDAIMKQFALGCDGVILHGATPAELAPIVDAYRPRRADR